MRTIPSRETKINDGFLSQTHDSKPVSVRFARNDCRKSFEPSRLSPLRSLYIVGNANDWFRICLTQSCMLAWLASGSITNAVPLCPLTLAFCRCRHQAGWQSVRWEGHGHRPKLHGHGHRLPPQGRGLVQRRQQVKVWFSHVDHRIPVERE